MEVQPPAAQNYTTDGALADRGQSEACIEKPPTKPPATNANGITYNNQISDECTYNDQVSNDGTSQITDESADKKAAEERARKNAGHTRDSSFGPGLGR